MWWSSRQQRNIVTAMYYNNIEIFLLQNSAFQQSRSWVVLSSLVCSSTFSRLVTCPLVNLLCIHCWVEPSLLLSSLLKLKTWIHDNLCYVGIKSDSGQHSQFLRCFPSGFPRLNNIRGILHQYCNIWGIFLHQYCNIRGIFLQQWQSWLFLLLQCRVHLSSPAALPSNTSLYHNLDYKSPIIVRFLS